MGAAGIGILQARGAQSITPSRYKPVWTDRFFQGYYTNRNPMRSPLSAYYAEGWGLGKTDALIAGQNIEPLDSADARAPAGFPAMVYR